MFELLRFDHKHIKDLQELLCMTFGAERKYFETAERVQIAEFSRFLYLQSIQRNQLSNKLIAVFAENNIVPNMTYINKGKNQISGLDLKRILEDKKYSIYIKECMELDNSLIQLCKKILKNDKLSASILDVITKELNFLILHSFKISELINKYSSQGINYNNESLNSNRRMM